MCKAMEDNNIKKEVTGAIKLMKRQGASENDIVKLKRFENAINEFLDNIGWNHSGNNSNNNQEMPNNTIHRMGDNQVVDFNIGM